MTTQTDSRQRLDNMRLGALRNPGTPVWQDVEAGRLVVRYQPIRNGVTGRIDKRATKDAIPSLLYVYEVHHEGGVTSLLRECDLLALLDGEPLADVQRRREEDAGNPFALVQGNLPLWARGG